MIKSWFGLSSSGGQGTGEPPRSRAGVLFMGGAAAVLIGGGAAAITDTQFLYSTPQTGFNTISPAELVPSQSFYEYGRGPGELRHFTSGFEGCYFSGLHLPFGAKITRLTVLATSGASFNTLASIQRASTSTANATDTMAQLFMATTASPVEASDGTIVRGTIVNGYSYSFQVCLATNQSFYGARIQYTYGSAGA
jgi:hypothetical protein